MSSSQVTTPGHEAQEERLDRIPRPWHLAVRRLGRTGGQQHGERRDDGTNGLLSLKIMVSSYSRRARMRPRMAPLLGLAARDAIRAPRWIRSRGAKSHGASRAILGS